ncbi:MAG: helix-turn-helix transcriptional regulator [Clostridia bacterium]|nr:helix-turn-helix transcriptional regulator [Clostridia bacterium]
MFYQLIHPAAGNHFVIERGENFNFPYHMHECFECIVSLEGKMTVRVGSTAYEIEKGEAVLVFPNQMHSLISSENKHILCIFSPKLVNAYYSSKVNKFPINNKFRPSDELIETMKNIDENTSYYIKKGYLYYLCDAFDVNADYVNGNRHYNDLIGKTLGFIETNYKEECTLEKLASSVGYNYVYLSRYFKKITGMSFKTYVNIYKLNVATHLFKTTSLSISTVASESGFQSVRSFNRNFKNYFGVSPNEYVRRENMK